MVAQSRLTISPQLAGGANFGELLALSGASLSGMAGALSPCPSLEFNDRRRLPCSTLHLEVLLRAYGFDGPVREWLASHPAGAGEALDVSLSLSLPGESASAWLDAPGERAPTFFSTYAAVSLTVQRALRRWVPYVYFSDLTRYDDVLAAWPLLVYQAMLPFRGMPKSEFTYDVQHVGTTLLMRDSTVRGFTAAMHRLRHYLETLGKAEAARFYDPEEAPSILTDVARQPRWLNALLSADAFFVESLLALGLRGRAFAEMAAGNPARAAKKLARFAERFVTHFHRRLRRLYAGRDFTPLGTLLLIEATRALCAARGHAAPLRAILRLAAGDRAATFVHSA